MHIVLEIITFLIVIVVLILVHELGHFIVAKLSGMRVDEFGIGYPPRALTIGKIGETEYTLNWLPFGGFVRIYGEDGGEAQKVAAETIIEGEEMESLPVMDMSRSFVAKPRILQALVLVAGVTMNIILAYVLITASMVMGSQQVVQYGQENGAKNLSLAFESVRPGSPAAEAGFMAGDIVKSTTIKTAAVGIGYTGTNPEGFATLTSLDKDLSPMVIVVDRNGKMLTINVTPKLKVIPGSPSQPAIGVEVVEVGVVKIPFKDAITQGATETWGATKATAVGLYDFFKNIVLFKADLSQVSGPIGIAGVVGQASANGLSALLSLVALISINLALINLLPIPALDGGRLLFVIIEAIIRRPLNPKIAERVNMVGFVLLILLMVVVSAHDIFKLFQ
jgi:regulator of sigma E protease